MLLRPARLGQPGVCRASSPRWHCTSHGVGGPKWSVGKTDNLLLLPEQTVKGKGEREKVGENVSFYCQISSYSEMGLLLIDLAEVVPPCITY